MVEIPSKHRIKELIEPFQVKPGSKVSLPDDFDPGFKDYITKKDAADNETLKRGTEALAEYQARLAAQGTHALLVVLQALDAAGKDGTIKHVMSGVNPQGVEVRSFKVPTAEELSHNYLWRYTKALPERGRISIFNRSHYEEVLVVRVHPENLDRQRLPPEARGKDIWERRFREINDWERQLVDNSTYIVKLFLNVSKEEQRQRFLARIDEPEKNWKFSASDARERRYWDDYQKAYEELLSNTSTAWAPWYVIPADRKWFSRLAVAVVMLHALMEIDPQYPEVGSVQRQELAKAKMELEAEEP